jgi:hypothetical protein
MAWARKMRMAEAGEKTVSGLQKKRFGNAINRIAARTATQKNTGACREHERPDLRHVRIRAVASGVANWRTLRCKTIAHNGGLRA